MTIVDKRFTHIYNPKTVDNFILVPRIKAVVSKGINSNLLFHGQQGLGKSALLKKMAEKYSDVLYFNCAENGQIDALREGGEIYNFCVGASMEVDDTKERGKILILDELNGVSDAFQEGLKGFMDKFGGVVKFCGTTNFIHKIQDAIISRFDGGISFDFQTAEEREYYLEKYTARIKKLIAGLRIEIEDDVLEKLIQNKFPDMRTMLGFLQRVFYADIKVIDSALVDKYEFEFIELYKIILSGDLSTPEKTYELLQGDYSSRPEDVLVGLDKPFINYIVKSEQKFIPLIPFIISNVGDWTYKLSVGGKDQSLFMRACAFDLIVLVNKFVKK
jgi:DNA polymerase III delta prime subunit